MNNTATTTAPRQSLWTRAAYKFRRDRVGILSLAVVLLFAVMAAGAALGFWATNWSDVGDSYYGPISAQHWFGTNVNGQDIFARTVYSTRVAFEVGVVVALTWP